MWLDLFVQVTRSKGAVRSTRIDYVRRMPGTGKMVRCPVGYFETKERKILVGMKADSVPFTRPHQSDSIEGTSWKKEILRE